MYVHTSKCGWGRITGAIAWSHNSDELANTRFSDRSRMGKEKGGSNSWEFKLAYSILQPHVSHFRGLCDAANDGEMRTTQSRLHLQGIPTILPPPNPPPYSISR